jgi:hypothetical protein
MRCWIARLSGRAPNTGSKPTLASSFQRRRRHLQLQVHLRQPLLQHAQLDLRDPLDVLGAEAVEHHRLVDAVQELGAEVVLQLVPHRLLHVLVRLAHHGLDHVRADVGGHHDHRVLEVHGAALAVGEAAVVQHLQQHVERRRGAPSRPRRAGSRCTACGARPSVR